MVNIAKIMKSAGDMGVPLYAIRERLDEILPYKCEYEI